MGLSGREVSEDEFKEPSAGSGSFVGQVGFLCTADCASPCHVSLGVPLSKLEHASMSCDRPGGCLCHLVPEVASARAPTVAIHLFVLQAADYRTAPIYYCTHCMVTTHVRSIRQPPSSHRQSLQL